MARPRSSKKLSRLKAQLGEFGMGVIQRCFLDRQRGPMLRFGLFVVAL